MMRLIVGMILVAGLWITTWYSGAQVDALRPALPEQTTDTFMPVRFLGVTTLGYDQLFADILWMNSIQYFATQEEGDKTYEEMYARTRLITDLDPQFEYVYRFGWLILTFFDTRDSSELMNEATDLLARGWRRHPDSCRMAKTRGFHHYYYLHDYSIAANLLDEAARLCDFPRFTLLAARLRAHAGDEATAIAIMEQIMREPQPEHVADQLRTRLKQLRTMQVLRILRSAADRYARDHREAYPPSLDVLRQTRYISAPPPNFLEGRYVVDSRARRIYHSAMPDDLKVYRPD